MSAKGTKQTKARRGRDIRYLADTVAELDEKQRPDNNRIGTNTFLNQYFALTPDLELMLLAWAHKIVLQHNLAQCGP